MNEWLEKKGDAEAFKALSSHLKNQLNKMVEKYTPKNKVKV